MKKTYKVTYSDRADKALHKLDRPMRILIMSWIEKNLVDCTDPRRIGKALTRQFKGSWRYRVGEYRLIAEIKDEEVLILAAIMPSK